MNREGGGVQSDRRVSGADNASEISALNVVDVVVHDGDCETVPKTRVDSGDA